MGQQLPKEQAEILKMLTVDYLTVKQIASRREKSVRSVYKIVAKLKKKGLLAGGSQRGFTNPGVPLRGGGFTTENKYLKEIRLHAEHFLVDFISVPRGFRSRFPVGSRLVVDGDTVFFWRDKVEIYSNRSFFGSDVDVCDRDSFSFWSVFLRKLEDRFGLILLKPGVSNVLRVRAEFAEVGNELAVVSRKEREKIRVIGGDGRAWLVADFSHSLDELETVHKDRSKEDMGLVVAPFFNDLRKNPVLLSEVVGIVASLARESRETASGLRAVVELLKPREFNDEVVVLDRPSYVG